MDFLFQNSLCSTCDRSTEEIESDKEPITKKQRNEGRMELLLKIHGKVKENNGPNVMNAIKKHLSI